MWPWKEGGGCVRQLELASSAAQSRGLGNMAWHGVRLVGKHGAFINEWHAITLQVLIKLALIRYSTSGAPMERTWL